MNNLALLLNSGLIEERYLPVEGIIHAVAVGSIETEPIWFKTKRPSPVLIIVYVEDGVVKSCDAKG